MTNAPWPLCPTPTTWPYAKAGAVALGYALSYSMGQLHILQRLVRLNGGPVGTGELDIDKLFGEEDILKFN